MNPPENPRAAAVAPAALETQLTEAGEIGLAETTVTAPEYHGLRWFFIGREGLRAGWSVALFLVLAALFMSGLSAAATYVIKNLLHHKASGFTAVTGIIGGVIEVLGILAAAAIVAWIEHRRVPDYNLAGPRRILHFVSGLAAGFLALSALVGALAWGGWLHFGPVSLAGTGILKYGVLWGAAFLLTGLFEEGSFRCFLQFTFTRGINFWVALGLIAAICAGGFLAAKGQCVWGVYLAAMLGLAPCLWLHLKKVESAGFWQASWVTSTLFGFIHTGNGGENWIGIFAAAAIGFVFCVSVRLTGSAWWAIGCHAAWDWAETYFYGTADSGYVATGHYLSTSVTGNALWSGGTDGPEGSLLVLGVILLLLVALVVIYGRGTRAGLVAK